VVQLPEAERVDPLLEVALLLQQPVHLFIVHRLGEAGADLVELIEEHLLLLDPFHHVAPDILGRVEPRLLREVANSGAWQGARIAQEVLVHSSHDSEESGFSCAVGSQDADLGAGIKGEIDALENLAGGGHDLAEVAHREDVFAGHGVGR
jgi:hypothetical protein